MDAHMPIFYYQRHISVNPDITPDHARNLLEAGFRALDPEGPP